MHNSSLGHYEGKTVVGTFLVIKGNSGALEKWSKESDYLSDKTVPRKASGHRRGSED